MNLYFALPIEQVIADYLKNQTPENAARLVSRMRETAFYAPVAPIETGMADHLEALRPVLIHFDSSKGEILPLYTSREKLFLDHKNSQFLEMKMPGLTDFLQAHPEIGFLLINPNGDAITFDTQSFLQTFADQEIRMEYAAFQPGDVLTFSVYTPEEQAANQTAQAARQFPKVNRLWLARGSKQNENRSDLFLVVDAGIMSRDQLSQLGKVCAKALNEPSIRILMADDEAARDIVASFKPAYIR